MTTLPTYYVQIGIPEEDFGRWHTIARVDDRTLAEEIARLAEGSYGRATVITHFTARVISRSALEREHARQHADWELGAGNYRGYGNTLREKAERNLRSARA
ncbi:MAG: hypothetical protein ACRDM8_10160 [Gaiellaceae bacterium]